MQTAINTATKSENKSEKISAINSLVLFSFRTAQPSTNILNKKASVRISDVAGADKDSARLYNTLLQRKGTIIGRIASLFNATSKKLREKALPHAAGGYYLRAKDVGDVQHAFDDAQAELESLKQELIAVWDTIPRPNLGTFEKDFKMPTAESFASKYSMELEWMKRPASIEGTVLEGVSNETAARVRAQSQRSRDKALKEAHAQPVKELLATLVSTVEQIDGGKRLRSERFENIKRGLAHLKDMNWLELSEIDSLVVALQPCCIDRSEITSDLEKEKVKHRIQEAARVARNTLTDLGIS